MSAIVDVDAAWRLRADQTPDGRNQALIGRCDSLVTKINNDVDEE